jgi:hypothetical protein
MTSLHSDRANGDSYFTVEDLGKINELLAISARRCNRADETYELVKIAEKVSKEIEYIKSMKK